MATFHPLANPAGAGRRTVGVSDPVMADRVVRTLAELGVERALVFYGHDGLDELTVTTTSKYSPKLIRNVTL